jgi:hypothetical protein
MITDTSHYAEYPDGTEGDHTTVKHLAHFAQPYTHRRVAFWNTRTGEILSEHGDGQKLSTKTSLADVLDMLERFPAGTRPQTLYLIGGGKASTIPPRDWWTAPARAGWDIDDYERKTHAATYQRGEGRAKIKLYVRASSVWFDDLADQAEPRLVRAAYLALRDLGNKHFDPKCTLLDTPSMTGQDWLRRTLPTARTGGTKGRAPVEYPAAPAALVDMLYHNATQGRMQFCPHPDVVGQEVAGLYVLDARWQYAACLSNLPVGIPDHDSYPYGADAIEAFVPYAPGWYRVAARVPLDWRHLGLIGDPTRADENANDKWPDAPGAWIGEDGGVWIGGAQLGLAIEQGWPVLIFERWVYRDVERMPGANPAGEFRRRMVELRKEASDTRHYPAEQAALMAAGARSIVIAAIGRWHARSRAKLQITPGAQEKSIKGNIPGMTFVDHKANTVYWYKEIPFTEEQRIYCQPQWSASVWDRSAFRTNRQALYYPRRDILAVRSDALVLLHKLVLHDPDYGNPGEWRYKEQIPGPLLCPPNADAMQVLRHSGEEDE